jgi:hypothetical protein
MEEHHKKDESVVIDETVFYVSRRTHSQRTIRPPAPSPWATAVYVILDAEQEEPSKNAEIKFKIRDVPEAAPSDRAEVNISLTDGEGSVRVPGGFAGQLLDGCVAVACAVSVGFTTKWVLEAAADSLQGWIVLPVVVVQVFGVAVLAWRAMRRQR